MNAVVEAIPNVECFLSLEPEELGAKLLFLAKDRGMFSPSSFETEIWEDEMQRRPTYPRSWKDAIALAFAEAWAWLEAQGLIVRAPDQGRDTSYRVLSRRAGRFQSEAEFANYAVARMLQREALHPKLADRVWMAFMRGEFDVAAFQGMKAVEGSTRDAAGLGNHSLRTTGITDCLKSGGTLEHAQEMANHSSPRTTKLCDRRSDETSLNEYERVGI